MDLGREPEARFPDSELVLSTKSVSFEDIEYVISRIGAFGEDNRAGVERTLIPLATHHRWLRDSASVELAMLVRRSDLDAVRAAGEALRRDFAKVPFLLSGPWPLEVFTDDHQQ